MRDIIPAWLRAPRTTTWLVLAALLLAFVFSAAPQKFEVAVYKAALIALAAVLGYWLDRALFPYSRPDGYLARDWRYGTDEPLGDVDYPVVTGYASVFAAAMLRRALVVGCVIFGVAQGL